MSIIVFCLINSSHFSVSLKKYLWIRDDGDITESWSHPGKISDVLEIIKDWDPRCKALVELSPGCIDWKLVRRDPLPSWVSRAGYIILIGDAAHPCLP